MTFAILAADKYLILFYLSCANLVPIGSTTVPYDVFQNLTTSAEKQPIMVGESKGPSEEFDKSQLNSILSSNLSTAGQVMNIYLPCLQGNRPIACFQGRSEDLLDTLDSGFALGDYVSIVRRPGVVSLSQSAAQSLLAKMISFLATRSVLVKVPDITQFFDERPVQGRKKKDKGHGYLMMMMMMAGWMVSIKLAALAAVAGKALAASMAALMLAAIAALKRHESGSHHRDYEVISLPASHNLHHHQRSYEIDDIRLTTASHRPTSYLNSYNKEEA